MFKTRMRPDKTVDVVFGKKIESFKRLNVATDASRAGNWVVAYILQPTVVTIASPGPSDAPYGIQRVRKKTVKVIVPLPGSSMHLWPHSPGCVTPVIGSGVILPSGLSSLSTCAMPGACCSTHQSFRSTTQPRNRRTCSSKFLPMQSAQGSGFAATDFGQQ